MDFVEPNVQLTQDDWNYIVDSWEARCKNLGIKPGTKKYKDQVAAYMQGVLALGLSTGLISETRASQIGFLVIVGREEMVLNKNFKI